jgi:hypothetical protein
MLKKIPPFLATLLSLGLAVLPSCTPPVKIWHPPETKNYLDLNNKTVLVMPVDIHLPSDTMALGAALLGGFLKEIGPNAISLQPINPALEKIGLANLSAQLAHGIIHAAFTHKSTVWDACGDEDYTIVPESIAKLIDKYGELLGRPHHKPDYLIVLHLDYNGPGTVPKTLNYRVNGGVYDISKKEIAIAFEWEQTTSEDALIAEMAALGKRILNTIQGEMTPHATTDSH